MDAKELLNLEPVPLGELARSAIAELDALRQRKRRADSAGLGRLVVRRVAEAHGGGLMLAPGPGGGALVALVRPAPG